MNQKYLEKAQSLRSKVNNLPLESWGKIPEAIDQSQDSQTLLANFGEIDLFKFQRTTYKATFSTLAAFRNSDFESVVKSEAQRIDLDTAGLTTNEIAMAVADVYILSSVSIWNRRQG